MKIDVERPEIQTNVDAKRFSFQIDNDSHVIFEGLRKTLYPNPIRAVGREILANSLDANQEAGRSDHPVEVSFTDNYLVIRDHGIGISPTRIEQVFCWYGRSTKNGDDKQVGGFGIGAKSLFAAADSFIVDTIHDGVKYVYSAFIGESLKGDMVLMHQENTDEISGTAIKLPYKPSDRYAYRQAIKESTKFWKVPPVFHGEMAEPPFTPTLDTDKWAIYLKDTDGYNVLSGTIPYKYSNYSIPIPSKVVLKFEIGELDLVLNRDDLRESEKTVKAIKDRLALYHQEVATTVQDQLDKVETFGEVMTIIDSIPGSHNTSRKWNYRGSEFFYPLSFPVTVFERIRTRLSSYNTKILDNTGIITDNHFILLDKPEVTSYDRQRIGSLLNTTGLKRVYLLSKDNQLPVKPIGLSTIKIPRAPRVPGAKKAKTTIKGRTWRNRRMQDFLIDTPNQIIYVVGDTERLKGVGNLGVTVVGISDKDVKHIDDEPNWVPLDEYVQLEIYDKLSTEQIQKIADHTAAVAAYDNFKFLANHHEDFKFLTKPPVTVAGLKSERSKELVQYLVSNGLVTPKPIDLYKKYPMLKMVRYISTYGDEPKMVKQYVDLVNSNTKTD